MAEESFTCTACDAEVPNNANFCPSCGEKFDGFEDEDSEKDKPQKAQLTLDEEAKLFYEEKGSLEARKKIEQESQNQSTTSLQPSNPLAIAGFVLGISSIFLFEIGIVPILAIVFSSIGLSKVKEQLGIGKNEAWIGLILGILYFLVYMNNYGHLAKIVR